VRDDVKEGAQKEEQCVLELVLLSLGIFRHDLGDINDYSSRCGEDNQASKDVGLVVFQSDAAGAEDHI